MNHVVQRQDDDAGLLIERAQLGIWDCVASNVEDAAVIGDGILRLHNEAMREPWRRRADFSSAREGIEVAGDVVADAEDVGTLALFQWRRAIEVHVRTVVEPRGPNRRSVFRS